MQSKSCSVSTFFTRLGSKSASGASNRSGPIWMLRPSLILNGPDEYPFAFLRQCSWSHLIVHHGITKMETEQRKRWRTMPSLFAVGCRRQYYFPSLVRSVRLPPRVHLIVALKKGKSSLVTLQIWTIIHCYITSRHQITATVPVACVFSFSENALGDPSWSPFDPFTFVDPLQGTLTHQYLQRNISTRLLPEFVECCLMSTTNLPCSLSWINPPTKWLQPALRSSKLHSEPACGTAERSTTINIPTHCNASFTQAPDVVVGECTTPIIVTTYSSSMSIASKSESCCWVEISGGVQCQCSHQQCETLKNSWNWELSTQSPWAYTLTGSRS